MAKPWTAMLSKMKKKQTSGAGVSVPKGAPPSLPAMKGKAAMPMMKGKMPMMGKDGEVNPKTEAKAKTKKKK